MLYKKSFKMYSTLYIVALIIFLSLFSNITLATQTIFDNVNITKNLTVMGLNVASCDVKTYTNGTLYCGTDATGAGGGGANISSTTCSGTQKVSAINNATGAVTCSADTDTDTFNTTAEMRTAINNTLGTFNITSNNSIYFNGYATSFFQNGTELFNTSSEIWAVIDNSTFHKFSQTITWGNLSSWNLNSAWTGELGWANLTSYPTACTGTNKVTGIGDTLTCAADVDTANTSAEMQVAVNQSGYYYQINVNRSNYWDGYDTPSGWDLDSSNDLTTATSWSGDLSGTGASPTVVKTQGLTWGNLTTFSLNSAWTGSLGWGNLTGYDLNKAWANTLGAGNITSGTITATQLASTFAINLGNVTDVANCTAAQKVIGKVGSAWVCGTDLFNTTEEMQDAAGALLGGTETLITVTYDDANGDIDFVVNNDLHSYSWTNVVDADITNTLTASNLVAGANVDIGAWELRASTFQSDVAAGTAPFIVASATQVANLNVSYAGTAYDLTCTDCIGGTEITVLTDADVNDAITIAGAVWVNSSTGMNTTKIYAPLICGDQACTHNITWNNSNWIIYG
jgi:hypothetical protein